MYQGLLDVGRIKAGETLVVTGAAGATGSHVCQIGKIHGAKVFAIAGSAEKVEWLEKELGVDKAFNYKSATFHDEFEKSVGKFDVLFDNVGGDILDYMLTRLNVHARVAFCGMPRRIHLGSSLANMIAGAISQYSEIFRTLNDRLIQTQG